MKKKLSIITLLITLILIYSISIYIGYKSNNNLQNGIDNIPPDNNNTNPPTQEVPPEDNTDTPSQEVPSEDNTDTPTQGTTPEDNTDNPSQGTTPEDNTDTPSQETPPEDNTDPPSQETPPEDNPDNPPQEIPPQEEPEVPDNDKGENNSSSSNEKKWSLIWSDEFETNNLNTSNWWYQYVGNTGPFSSNQLQYYTKKDKNTLSMLDGNLKITALYNKEYNSLYGTDYISARITSSGKQEFSLSIGTPLRVEGKIKIFRQDGNKLTTNSGIWPAFWMKGNNTSDWPDCGEIDIMETLNDGSNIYGSMHFGETSTDKTSITTYYNINNIYSISDYHIYAIEWDGISKIYYYFDNINYSVVDLTNNDWASRDTLGNFTTRKWYIILNMSVGAHGSWAQKKDSTWSGSPDYLEYPINMYVDYVRVYNK